jgi:hypothetical protein
MGSATPSRGRRARVGADGSIYVTAIGSKNVFKRTPSGIVSQLIDATGDGIGHTLQYPRAGGRLHG